MALDTVGRRVVIKLTEGRYEHGLVVNCPVIRIDVAEAAAPGMPTTGRGSGDPNGWWSVLILLGLGAGWALRRAPVRRG